MGRQGYPPEFRRKVLADRCRSPRSPTLLGIWESALRRSTTGADIRELLGKRWAE